MVIKILNIQTFRSPVRGSRKDPDIGEDVFTSQKKSTSSAASTATAQPTKLVSLGAAASLGMPSQAPPPPSSSSGLDDIFGDFSSSPMMPRADQQQHQQQPVQREFFINL